MAHATVPTHGSTCRTEKGGVVMDFTEGWTVNAAVDLAEIEYGLEQVAPYFRA